MTQFQQDQLSILSTQELWMILHERRQRLPSRLTKEELITRVSTLSQKHDIFLIRGETNNLIGVKLLPLGSYHQPPCPTTTKTSLTT